MRSSGKVLIKRRIENSQENRLVISFKQKEGFDFMSVNILSCGFSSVMNNRAI